MTTPPIADAYRQFAARLDALPSGYPATSDGLELAVLARLFTPEEAALAAQLRLTPETPAALAARIWAARPANCGWRSRAWRVAA